MEKHDNKVDPQIEYALKCPERQRDVGESFS